MSTFWLYISLLLLALHQKLRWKETAVTTHSFKNVVSFHPITPFPLEILIDTSSNRNSNPDFCFQKRNRAWLYFYSTIQILRTSSVDSPIFWPCTWQWCAYIIENRHRSVREESGIKYSRLCGIFMAARGSKCRIPLHWSPKVNYRNITGWLKLLKQHGEVSYCN